MKDFAGKISFITGGASGAGLGQAKVFAKAGMKVAIADVRRDALHNAVGEIVERNRCGDAYLGRVYAPIRGFKGRY